MENKDINFANLSADSLVEMAKESHRKVMKEASKREDEHKKRVAALTEKERGLKEEIETAKEQLEKMSEDFDALEATKKEENLAEIKSNAMMEADVKSGKISISQFQSQGMKDDEIQKTAITKTVEDLERASDLIRSKGAEITRLELSLYETQCSIHSLLTQPIRSLRLSYRELGNMLDFQLEGLTKDGHNSQALKVEKQNQIMLIEKEVGMTTGHTWSNVSLKEAYRIRLSPILPKRLIISLVEKLSEIEIGSQTRLTVVYHQPGTFWPGDEIEIREEI